MTRTDDAYLDDLTVHLRLAGVSGRDIGAILEEARDHLTDSGQAAEDAFGPAEDYARALVKSRGDRPSTRPDFSRADLVAAAVQILAWYLLVYAVVAVGTGTGVEVVPGDLAGVALLSAALVWPVWPSVRAFLARKVSILVPTAIMTAGVAAYVGLSMTWDEPVVVTVPAVPAILVSILAILACWVRVLRLRDPIRRPTDS